MSWRIIEKYEPFAERLRVLDWTKPMPGLPLITAPGNDADAIFAAVRQAISDLQDDDRRLLGIRGIVRLPKEDYLKVPNPA